MSSSGTAVGLHKNYVQGSRCFCESILENAKQRYEICSIVLEDINKNWGETMKKCNMQNASHLQDARCKMRNAKCKAHMQNAYGGCAKWYKITYITVEAPI